MKITPVNEVGDSCTGRLNASFADVERILGFPANVSHLDDPYKVTHSWGFEVDGVRCGIWDYKGSEVLSTFGPSEILFELFGNAYKC
jgi:hypothetical protein